MSDFRDKSPKAFTCFLDIVVDWRRNLVAMPFLVWIPGFSESEEAGGGKFLVGVPVPDKHLSCSWRGGDFSHDELCNSQIGFEDVFGLYLVAACAEAMRRRMDLVDVAAECQGQYIDR